MKKYYLKNEPLSGMFYVMDSVVSEFIDNEEIPQFEIDPQDYPDKLGCAAPKEDAPVVGYLAERNGDCYAINRANAKALAEFGFKVRLLTYHHCASQMKGCGGVVINGGAFTYSELYYTDPRDGYPHSSLANVACAVILNEARGNGLPVLGIGIGAQAIAGEFELKFYRSSESIETPIEHYNDNNEAHRISVMPNTPLSRIFGENDQFKVNSRHHAVMLPLRTQQELWAHKLELWAHKFRVGVGTVSLPLDIYAEANDGTPEAWGSESKHILCVQWLPAEMIAQGSEMMRGVFEWLAEEISA